MSIKNLKRVLVANDSLEGLEAALQKAALIEHHSGAEIEVAEVIYDNIEEEHLEEHVKSQLIESFKAAERNGLRKLLEPYKDKIAWSRAQVLWSKYTDEAIIGEAERRSADLIIKPMSHHSTLSDLIHTPLDWQIIRTANCPVLISKSPEWGTGGIVLGAVDISDAKHKDLSIRVLETTNDLATILDADLHIVCVYPDLGQRVSQYQVALDYEGIKDDMRAARQQALEETLEKLEINAIELHVIEGKPAVTVANLANRLDVTVAVLGTSARTGLKKLLLGNTSEAMIGRLKQDILTVRTSR